VSEAPAGSAGRPRQERRPRPSGAPAGAPAGSQLDGRAQGMQTPAAARAPMQ